MPPNHFESEVESFLEGSHGDRTHIKRADHPRLHHYAGRYFVPWGNCMRNFGRGGLGGASGKRRLGEKEPWGGGTLPGLSLPLTGGANCALHGLQPGAMGVLHDTKPSDGVTPSGRRTEQRPLTTPGDGNHDQRPWMRSRAPTPARRHQE